MYAGYAWLTNNVARDVADAPGADRRDGGFLVMALAIPEVFGAGR